MGERPLCPLRCSSKLGKAAAGPSFGQLSARAGGAIGPARSVTRGRGREALRARMVWWSALPMLLPVPALAQAPASALAPSAVPAPAEIVTFSADQVIYDSDADQVTATGEVRMDREGNYLAADQVVWDRKSG